MGKKAFMPGQLIHTNEILVLLGDNWFAERSAKQACEIINRRISGGQIYFVAIKVLFSFSFLNILIRYMFIDF